MDGVLVRGNTPVAGAAEFLKRLESSDRRYLVVTNNSMYTPLDLAHRLRTMGLHIIPERIFTSAMATANFLNDQAPAATAFVVGESGLTTAIHHAGYVITEIDPDYVVLGESSQLNIETITTAVRLVADGARFIATNPDTAGPTESGIAPATGAVAALIEKASGVSPYVVGKPNPYMFRAALNHLDVHSEDTYMVGDNLHTDIKGGMEAGLETVLVMSGVTAGDAVVARSPYRPNHIVGSVAEISLLTEDGD
ncbi:MAG: HAD-IIA family hydrolase [Acidimicrobiia bacterium]|nr:HAD-IIA family hydrolase [Acidimicrobiia bacterium]